MQVKKISADKTSYTVTGLDSSAAYNFKMRAYKQLSDGKTIYYGDYSSVVIEATNPNKVTLTSVTKSGSTIKVNWKKQDLQVTELHTARIRTLKCKSRKCSGLFQNSIQHKECQ